jgi:hypothetical protein
MSENENPEIFNREMELGEDVKGTMDHSDVSFNGVKNQSVEFSFLEISIISVSLFLKIMRKSEEIFCTISCETTCHEVQSCISSNEGKYFFPKEYLKYILTHANQKLTFTFHDFKQKIGISCFEFDAQSLTSKRYTLPIELNDQTIGEVTFLPQLQEEVVT